MFKLIKGDFQFHKGTIKAYSNKGHDLATRAFNSIKVQLRPYSVKM